MKRQHRATVDRFRKMKVGDIVTRERARLPCGCAMWVGLTGEMEAATRSQPCSVRHEVVMERANALLREAQTHPTPGRELVLVCVTVLSQAAKERL